MATRRYLTAGVARSLGTAAGLALDRVVGEPPVTIHPVARFGSAMAALETRTHRDGRTAGAVHLMIGAGGAAAVGWCLQRVVGRTAATAIAAAVSIGGRMLGDEALAVAQLLHDDDLPGARLRITSLVGRDTTLLGPHELSRATIESVAENSVDAVTAPLMWGVLGGAPALLAHRAINTLDAMVGHRTDRYRRFGWASARADDIVNWLPARLSALTVASLTPARAAAIVRTVRRDAPQHPSPNGGVIEAAFAAALDVQLGGTNVYDGHAEARGLLGDGRAPTDADIADAVRLARRMATRLAVFGVVLGVTAPVARRQLCICWAR